MQVMPMFGPAQARGAGPVVYSVVDGTLPMYKARTWVIVCGVFIRRPRHDNKKIYKNNYEPLSWPSSTR